MSKLRLKIEEFVPHIFLVEKEKLTKITKENDNLLDCIEHILALIELKISKAGNINEQYAHYISLARESDENFVDLNLELKNDSQEFELWANIEPALRKVNDKTILNLSKIRNIETKELLEELDNYRKQDILASSLIAIYDILISKLLLAANELEIFEFELEDLHGNPSLAEYLGQSFERMNLDFAIVQS